ncbi:MAG: hypothetical protein HY370_07310 [Proteobacteria bacterium]|nr:hypothetical protein [Pseudomonadota bacterium]
MRQVFVLSLFFIVLTAAGAARAEPKPWIWSWWPSHWKDLDFRPYIEEGQHQHNSQWDKSLWEPAHWIEQKPGDRLQIMRDFYKSDILRGQYEDNDVPVLEVGPAFYMLGGEDRRRVVRTVDEIYEITPMHENAMFMLYDWRTKKPIGAYTRYGLQLQ